VKDAVENLVAALLDEADVGFGYDVPDDEARKVGKLQHAQNTARRNPETVDYWQRRVWLVLKPLRVYVSGASRPSNEYYGSSRVHRSPAYKLELQPGDSLIYASSLFAQLAEGPHAGDLLRVQFGAPKGSSFEKTYGGDMTDLKLKQLHQSRTITPSEEDLPSPFHPVDYSPQPGDQESQEGRNEWPRS
jgi:hypothetical protein